MRAPEYPKMLYSPDQEPVTVHDRAEQDALNGEWFDKPDFSNHDEEHLERNSAHETRAARHVHREYPKMLYSPDQEPITVNDEDEEEALEGEWFDKPDFTNHVAEGHKPPKLSKAEQKEEKQRQSEAERAAVNSGEKPGKTPPPIVPPAQTAEEIEQAKKLNPSGLDVTGRARADAENEKAELAAKAVIEEEDRSREREATRLAEAEKDAPEEKEPTEAEVRRKAAKKPVAGKDADDLL